jgi:glycyl-tRNA synthetase
MPKNLYDTITALAKRRGFFWPSFEIYGGLRGFMTYGDLGTKLRRNIMNVWRKFFVRRQGFLELDAPIINPSKVFEASGHLENFKEYLVECTQCGRSFRADHLIEDRTGMENVEAMGGDAIRRLLLEKDIKCPRCGGGLKEPVMFLTMFQTEIGATGGAVGFTRPETAQGMFLNFRRGFQHAREKLPFALAQTGKVLRNEISPRRGLLRVREFTIMELELFFDPQQPSCPWFDEVSGESIRLLTEGMEAEGEKTPLETTVREAAESGYIQTEWNAYFMGVSKRFVSHLGVPPERQRFRAHMPAERSHYSAQTFDHEVHLDSWGWIEVAGHAYRTDYDLTAHQRGSGDDMTVLRSDGTRFVPHVVEPSFGLDRLSYMALETSYERRKKRNILHLPRYIAPYQVSVFPLVTKDGLRDKAVQIYQLLLNARFVAAYDESGSIGRRYARSDEIGTPLAVTVDYDTLESGAVTVRDRDSWEQVTLNVGDLAERLRRYHDNELEFNELGEKVKTA